MGDFIKCLREIQQHCVDLGVGFDAHCEVLDRCYQFGLTGSLLSEPVLVIMDEDAVVFKEVHWMAVNDMLYHFTAHRGQGHRTIICKLAIFSLFEYRWYVGCLPIF